MALEYTEVIDVSITAVTVTSTSPTTLYSTTIDGGTLGDNNRVRWQMQGTITFGGSNQCIINMIYGGLTVGTCIIGSSASSAATGLRIDAELSGDGGPNSQFGTVHTYPGIPRSQDTSTPIGFGSIGIGSGGDQTLSISATWNGGGSSLSHVHSTLEWLSFSNDTTPEDLDEPTAQILISSKLNKMDWNMRKAVYFYAPLEYDLVFHGYGTSTFTRASTSTAVWRDGASHAVAVNQGRFEYSGETTLGIVINTSTEALSFDTVNLLSNSNTLIWIQDGILKSTPTNTNIFNSSGGYSNTTGVHIKHIVKFNRVLSASEISYAGALLT